MAAGYNTSSESEATQDSTETIKLHTEFKLQSDINLADEPTTVFSRLDTIGDRLSSAALTSRCVANESLDNAQSQAVEYMLWSHDRSI